MTRLILAAALCGLSASAMAQPAELPDPAITPGVVASTANNGNDRPKNDASRALGFFYVACGYVVLMWGAGVLFTYRQPMPVCIGLVSVSGGIVLIFHGFAAAI